jgi:hypothetical protein
MAMNLRHAAALALVGWYLMLPLVNGDASPATQLPLSEWTQEGSFDRAEDCKRALAERLQTAKQRIAKVKQHMDALPHSDRPLSEAAPDVYREDLQVTAYALNAYSGQCIASDDPRLAK